MKHIAMIAVAACMALGGCGKEEPASAPRAGAIAINAAVEGGLAASAQTATGSAWSGGEEIALNIRDEVRKYIASADGTLTAAPSVVPFFWEGLQEEHARAWHFGTYLDAEPEHITLQADQSDAGYGASDFLFASGTVERSNASPLVFTHKTAKVVFHVRSDGRAVQGLVLGRENLTLKGVWNRTTESLEPAPDGSGTVTAHAIAAAEGFDASYTALLVPQDMSGREFIRVTVDGREYAHTPEAGEASLEGGKCYTYNVTVRDGISVELLETQGWTYNGWQYVPSRKDFEAGELKPGDYLYLDCTWSDGGLRSQYSDGRLVWAEPKPAPRMDKKVIGIVFQTDPSRIGAREKELAAASGMRMNGVAMSVMEPDYDVLKGGVSWYYKEGLGVPERYTCDESIEDPAFPGLYLPNLWDEDYLTCYDLGDGDISGFFNTEVIRKRRAAEIIKGDYPLFWSLFVFPSKAEEPFKDDSCTGWYLPSVGQWLDYLRNVGGLHLVREHLEPTHNGDGEGKWPYIDQMVITSLNEAMSLIPDPWKTNFSPNIEAGFYWTSTHASPTEVRSIFMSESSSAKDSQVSLFCHAKHDRFKVRYAINF